MLDDKVLLKRIPLTQIVESKTNPRRIYEEEDMNELLASVKNNGVLTPIKVRPLSEENFEIIYGARRYRSSKLAGINDIPCLVVDITDDEAEAEQFTENMVRADVHPMDEAIKFAEMLDTKRKRVYTVKDIATLINKSETYVLQRLELNNMIEPLKKDFLANKFNISMAVQFVKIHPTEQKEARAYILRQNDYSDYGSLRGLLSYIERYVVRDLNKVPFDKEDPALNPEMGKCSTCPHRSGYNLLFADINKKDLCFRKECFDVKLINHTITQMENVINNHPDILFMLGWGQVDSIIEQYARQENITIHSQHTDGLSSYKSAGATPVKVLFVSGENIGKIMPYYRIPNHKKKADVKALATQGASHAALATAIEDNIDKIKDRQKRALELDAEKVWVEIHKKLIKTPEMQNNKKLTQKEIAALIVAMKSKMGFQQDNEVDKVLKRDSDKHNLYEKALTATPEMFNKICRMFIANILDSSTGTWSGDNRTPLYEMCAQYHQKEIDAIKAVQQVEADKRIGRSKERIADLEKQKKVLVKKTKETPKK